MVTKGERPSEVALGHAQARGINESLMSTALDCEPLPVGLSILCECGHSGCRTELEVNLEFYRGMCLRPNQFVVANGHHVVEVDRVVRRLGGLTIVESRYIGDALLPPAA
jgi:predicted ThiF/HesA family dinucleotide-utilizing enzyme